jgi:hypothetical protein
MTEYPRQQIAAQIAEYRAADAKASDLQCAIYGLVSLAEDPEIKRLALIAAEAIDLCREIAKTRARELYDSPTPGTVPAVEITEEAA